MSGNEENSRHLDRHRSRIGRRRKNIERAVIWVARLAPTCTTDAMRARLLDELLARIEKIMGETNG